MSTPNGATVSVHLPDGTAIDITDGVQALYDLVVQSMDWGSGFLTVEDALPVAHVARVCGFGGIDECESYIAEKRRQDAADAKREAERKRYLEALDVTAAPAPAFSMASIGMAAATPPRNPDPKPLDASSWED